MKNTVEVRVNTIIWAAISAALAIATTLLVTSAWSADAAPGDLDSTYVPTAGCRAFDLRPAPNQVGPRPSPLAAGEVYTQQITGGVGDCTGPLAIPADAVAVAMNVTAVGATAQTNLRLFPANLTEVPTLSNLNVSAGQAPFPNKVDVALSPDGAIKIFNQNGSVSVLADVVGYYTSTSLQQLATQAGQPGPAGPQGPAGPAGESVATMWAKIDADADDATILSGRGARNVFQSSLGLYDVGFDDPITGCGWIATLNDIADGIAPSGEIAVEQVNATTLLVSIFDSSGARVAPADDDGFTLLVICP